MTDILGQLLYKTAVELGIVTEGKATGGSTTTIIDTSATALKEFGAKDDDYWNGGIGGVRYDAGGLGAAPEWEYAEISDYVKSTQTITLQDALTVAVASGDRYWLAKRTFGSLYNLIQKINDVAENYLVPTTDITTITTASSQREYTLPAAASFDLRQVWLQRETSDSDDNQWVERRDWYMQQAAAGTAKTLVTLSQWPSGRALKLVYWTRPTPMNVYSDKLHERIHPHIIAYEAAIDLLVDRLAIVQRDPGIEARIANLQNKLARVIAENPVDTEPLNTTTGISMLAHGKRRRYPGDRDAYPKW